MSSPAVPRPERDNTPLAGESAPPAKQSGSLRAAVLTGLVAQALVILWIAASEIPARVFISSWSVSMPGILIMAALLLLARLVPARVRERWLSYRSILLVYVMVAEASRSVDAIVAAEGEIIRPVDPQSREVFAWFKDPAGNVMGIYQQPGLADTEK